MSLRGTTRCSAAAPSSSRSTSRWARGATWASTPSWCLRPRWGPGGILGCTKGAAVRQGHCLCPLSWGCIVATASLVVWLVSRLYAACGCARRCLAATASRSCRAMCTASPHSLTSSACSHSTTRVRLGGHATLFAVLLGWPARNCGHANDYRITAVVPSPGCGFFINTALVMLSVYVNIWVLLLMGLSVNQGGCADGWEQALVGFAGVRGHQSQPCSSHIVAASSAAGLVTLCCSAYRPQASWRLTPVPRRTTR